MAARSNAQPSNINSVNNTKPELYIRLATTEWCPYVCQENRHGKGFALEYLDYIAKANNVRFSYEFYPWSRAIKSVANGTVDGLATAVPAEAPNLRFTTSPTMNYKSCFFTLSENKWRYQSLSSLNKVNIGVINDYSYGEPIDSYLPELRKQGRVVSISGDNGLERLYKMLETKRIDTLLSDENVAYWHMGRKDIFKQPMIEKGCLAPQPFFMAFSPQFEHTNKLVEIMNQAFADKDNQTHFYNKILVKYRHK